MPRTHTTVRHITPRRLVTAALLFTCLGTHAGWVDRPDDMLKLWPQDVDHHDGKLRLLYASSPSLPQSRRDDWSYNIYVVELVPGKDPVQHRLYSGQSEHLGALSPLRLRRGHDQVLVQTHPDGNAGRMIEARTIPAGEVMSRNALLSMTGPDGGRIGPGELRDGTTDGDLFHATTTVDDDRYMVAWRKTTPEGEIVGTGHFETPGARARITGTFPLEDGGFGIVLDASALDGQALPGLDDASREHQVGGRTLRAHIGSATRLLLVEADGRTARDLVTELIGEFASWS